MKRYFKSNEVLTGSDEKTLAYWCCNADGSDTHYVNTDGTRGVSYFDPNGMQYPELSESSALALLDEPWKVAGEGWRLMEGHEVPHRHHKDEVYSARCNSWTLTSASSGSTVSYILRGARDLKAYRRRLPVNNISEKVTEWPRWFKNCGYVYRFDDESQGGYLFNENEDFNGNNYRGSQTVGGAIASGLCELTLAEVKTWSKFHGISAATKSTSTNTNMSDKTVTSGKFKVGDKVTSGDYVGWVVMQVTGISLSGVTCKSSILGTTGLFEPSDLTVVQPVLPTKFQVDTRGLEGVQRALVALRKWSNADAWSREKFPTGQYFAVGTEGNYPYLYQRSVMWNEEEYPLLSLDEAITILTTKPEPRVVEVKLNDTYTAIVTQGKDTVKVGCQEIPISAIKELVSKIEEVGK